MPAVTLAERAAAAAGRVKDPDGAIRAAVNEPPFVDLPDTSRYEPALGAEGDPDRETPVHIAWMRVMREVTHIAKGGDGGEFRSQSAGNYSFRGVDRTVNAFGPACRKHGIIIVPEKTEVEYRSNGKARECTVKVTWSIIGPKGDVLCVHPQTAGEALDYSDKATTKSQSVALRTLLLTLGLVPTQEPDPDSANIQREDLVARPTALSYVAEITNPLTSKDRFRQIWNELDQHQLRRAVVEFEGASGDLGDLFSKVANERWPKAQAAPAHVGEHDESGFGLGCATCRAMSVDLDNKAAAAAS
jgi:hypothetical protein